MTTNNNNNVLANMRITAQQAAEKRLQNKIAVNALRKAKFADKLALPKFAHLDLAMYHVHVALLRCASQPTHEFLTLCTHPLHLLLWSQSANRAALLTEVAPLLTTHDEPPELRSLAQLLKQSLPQLAVAFENSPLPEPAWLLICRRLIANPVIGRPLTQLQADQLYRFQLTQSSDLVANSIWFALSDSQKSDYREYSSSCFLYRWFDGALHQLKQLFKH